MAEGSLYETDIVAWANEQAREIRVLARSPGASNRLDWDNVAEEIESLGKSQVSAVRSKLRLILVHLIEIISAPDAEPRQHWRAEVVAFQDVAAVDCTRSMQGLIDLERVWASAVRESSERLSAYGQRVSRKLPASCPFTIEELVDKAFDVDAALTKLADAIASSRD